MNETRFRPFAAIRAIFFSDTESISETKDFDTLSNKDYINAGVTEENRKELRDSSNRLKAIIDKISKNRAEKKQKGKGFIEEYGPAEKGNHIYDKAEEINRIEKERAERAGREE